MDIIIGTTDFELEQPTAVAIGKFDGVHLGHRRLLEEIIKKKKEGLAACVFTFNPAPAVLFGISDGKELSSREEKRILFEKMGIDILIEFPLTKETAATPPEDFVQNILCGQMNAEYIASGTDLSFGAGGAGNAGLLKKMSMELGFTVKTIEKVAVDGIEVSSTYIRDNVERGAMDVVEKFLGMPYMVRGTVVHGKHIGGTIGFPTVNVIPPDSKLLPPNGVYYSEVLWRGRRFHAISNVGFKPTVTKERVMGVESYLYDFGQEIYGEQVEVYLYEFKRPEQQFAGLEALKAQLKEDIKAGALWQRRT